MIEFIYNYAYSKQITTQSHHYKNSHKPPMNFSADNTQQLTKVSQRLKNNKQVLSHLSQFSQASTMPSQSIYKMLEYQQQQQQESKQSVISLTRNSKRKQDQSQKQTQMQQHLGQRKVFELQRKVQFKEDMGFVEHIVKYLLVGFVIVFLIDFYFEIQNEIELKTTEIAQCYQDYHENNCLTPLQALVEQCKRLQYCASRDPHKVLRISSVFVKTIVGLITIVTDHLQLTGMLFVVVIILLYLYRPAMYHEEKVYKYE